MTEFRLMRHADPSGVSGTGAVAFGVEWDDGAVALHWPGDHPSTTAWGDMRDMEAIHGHSGLTVVEYNESERLLKAYQLVVPFIVDATVLKPQQVIEHPDHPGCLRLVFGNGHDKAWARWVALLDGSTYAASHEEVDGELRHTWITPDGSVWLIFHTHLEATA